MLDAIFKTRHHMPIGLDIGCDSVKMIQLAVNDGSLKVTAAEKIHIGNESADDKQPKRDLIISKIKQVLADGKFQGKDVVSCLPNEMLKVASMRLAETENDDIERSLKKEAAQRFGLDPDKDIINYIIAGDVLQGEETKKEAILFAAEGDAIKSHIEMLEECNLRPIALDTVPCALFRNFDRSMRRQEDRERTVVFIDIGSRYTTIVFGRDGEIAFVKCIPTGAEKFDQQVAFKLGVSVDDAAALRRTLQKQRAKQNTKGFSAAGEESCQEDELDANTRQAMIDAISTVAEELAREIALCFKYYTVTFRGKRVEQALVAGGGAYEGILLNVLKRQLTVEIEIAQPFRSFDVKSVSFDSDRRAALSEWAVAVGLCLKGLNGQFKKSSN